MTTGKDYGLPEEYAEWVEVPFHLVNIGDNYVTTHFTHYPNGPLKEGFSIVGIAKYFVPPKPKPTLPDVKPGAVVRYTARSAQSCRQGATVRAVFHGNDRWDVFWSKGGSLYSSRTLPSSELLADVNDDGFTVELEGLE